jgi:hypothetical protein
MAQEEFTYSVPAYIGTDANNQPQNIPAHNVDLIVTYDPTVQTNGYYTATAAAGTYTVLDGNGNAIRTDTITGIGPGGGQGVGGADNLFRIGTQPYVDAAGLNYSISNPSDTSLKNNGFVSLYYLNGYAEDQSPPGVIQNVTQRAYVAPAPPAPCYMTGTRIRVLRGLAIQDVPVERLRVGDLALTVSGKPRPIRWIGSRSYPGLTAPQADRPVRIKAGALADNVPIRDLLVSPDHALLVDDLFVAAGHLVNGTSVTRGEAVPDLTYWHVELDSHDLLLAENTPAESFLPMPGVRRQFDGAARVEASTACVPYADRTEHGPELAVLRERLIVRAGLSVEPTRFGAVRAWMDRCDGTRIAGWAQDAAHPNAPMCLDIVVDGAVVAMTLAEEYRADIAAAGVGDGRHGFDLVLDEQLTSGSAHTVEVRRSADGAVICAMAMDAAGTWTPLLAA